MTERRSRLEVIHDMLKAIQDKKNARIKPTHLLYKSNLSYKRLQGYLDELKQRGLVTEVEEKEHRMITLTDQGFKFLQDYQQVRAFTEAFGL